MSTKRVGSNLSKDKRGSDFNTRRYAENFPAIERTTDRFNVDQPFEMEYYLSDHSHTVSLDLFIRENPPYPKITPPEYLMFCVTNCPWFLSEGQWSGNIFGGGLPGPGWWPGYFDKFNYNVGGFAMANPGVAVPLDGYYKIRMFCAVAGVTNWGPGWWAGQITAGGAVLASKAYYEPAGLKYIGEPIDITTVAYLSAGTVVTIWQSAYNIAYYTAYNFCTWWGGHSLTIELIGV